jgi:2,3-dihydroxy-2,3-dihydrophenylpropionate dehydrogenase/cis-2,3-dihydrobiphenyl-2,3-diol dehydrogenase
LEKTEGCIIFTASPAGLSPVGGGILYVSSKHAVVGVIHRLAYELAPNIRVNGVAPGGVATDLRGPAALGMADRSVSGMRRRLEEAKARGEALQIGVQPEDVAGAYVYLASKENSRAVTGVIISTPGSMGTRGQYVSQAPPQQ